MCGVKICAGPYKCAGVFSRLTGPAKHPQATRGSPGPMRVVPVVPVPSPWKQAGYRISGTVDDW